MLRNLWLVMLDVFKIWFWLEMMLIFILLEEMGRLIDGILIVEKLLKNLNMVIRGGLVKLYLLKMDFIYFLLVMIKILFNGKLKKEKYCINLNSNIMIIFMLWLWVLKKIFYFLDLVTVKYLFGMFLIENY